MVFAEVNVRGLYTTAYFFHGFFEQHRNLALEDDLLVVPPATGCAHPLAGIYDILIALAVLDHVNHVNLVEPNESPESLMYQWLRMHMPQ